MKTEKRWRSLNVRYIMRAPLKKSVYYNLFKAFCLTKNNYCQSSYHHNQKYPTISQKKGQTLSEFFAQDAFELLPKEHPIKVYLDESIRIKELLESLGSIDIKSDIKLFEITFAKLCTIEKHFTRKENQLFPYLEKYGWTSPSQNMWAFHDQIRHKIKELRSALQDGKLQIIPNALQLLTQDILHLLSVEEQRLLPNALHMLSTTDWDEIASSDDEIGWMDGINPAYIHPSQDTKPKKLPFSIDGRIKLDEGYMLPEQINLLLQFMPVDITYVDENDRVVFYNRGEKRVFPRSAGIIGREVRFCHPPKSVDMVLEILQEFKAGNKDEAEFWINFKERFIHIRYFAIRDKDGHYKGVIEVSQDVTDIRKLDGEKRLLDWGE
jgi:DUF438 domain-containing protein